MDYLTAKQIAEIWGITANRVTILCKEGRIPGAFKIGKQWMVPEDTKKPTDGRTINAKGDTQELYFRFPFFMNMPADRYLPALSEEENELRTAQLLFLACDFDKAEFKFKKILNDSRDNYLRICALFFLCFISIEHEGGKHFEEYFTQFSLALSEDFEYKAEMKLLRPLLLCLFALYENAKENYKYDFDYDYSQSAYPVLYILSLVCGEEIKDQKLIEDKLQVYELIARQLEANSNIYEAQLLHVFLFAIYNICMNKSEMYHHLKKALRIAYDYDFLYPVANIYVYYTDSFNKLLTDYPESFGKKIRKYGKQTHKSYASFSEKFEISGAYSLLSERDYQYVRYALLGYSNKKIAESLNTSERTVATHFSTIFDKLGINKKSEIASLFSNKYNYYRKEQSQNEENMV